ncbi:putative TetR family transcriptional regulator [Microlunatus phosphovorus NM-1]|uniref:Putative TetR family transcriptional regulator n=1 Tax=Microlunatus phosphovorus (strain ATCC 700054 / DSM 10555 / JCM 9379 / NBRC 101784 / NCIMB 13414 / VKM Ac-1990 / NM-1) TaxID=1032480 RepID=F5XJX4_MICPN|nr:TetR/AcrR family transcriptional regulator [Microlunatus phosphovorus]BAK33470.1 putative TetR family transcriptional regulator [Microlunatus phosphovorus NM-1]
MIDHRSGPRRRGIVLEEAIREAALAELTEVGYGNLSMERVAQRARASKASVYSRWPSRAELVADLAHALMPDASDAPDTGDLRGDLISLFRAIAEVLAGPAGEALRGLLAEVLPDPARTLEIRSRSQHSARRALETVVQRAVDRGEVDANAVTPRRLDAGPAMLRQQFLFAGAPIPDDIIVGIVDEVALPLLIGLADQQREPFVRVE